MAVKKLSSVIYPSFLPRSVVLEPENPARHVPASKGSWHKAKDNIMGTEQYGTPSNSNNAAEWTVKFNYVTDVHQFLFATGDKQMWMVMEKV